MRVTKRTNIAMRVLMYCAAHTDVRVTKSDIARSCNASEHHLGQIVNQLSTLGFLDTWRGRYGGIALARPATEITLGSVFRELEAPVPMAECFDEDTNTCPLISACRLKQALAAAAESFYATLDAVTLDTLIDDNAPLVAIFGGGRSEPPFRTARVASG